MIDAAKTRQPAWLSLSRLVLLLALVVFATACTALPATDLSQATSAGIPLARITPTGPAATPSLPATRSPAESAAQGGDAPGRASGACFGTLAATVPNPEGPFYRPGAPMRTSLLEPGTTGRRLVLQGRVLSTGCEPLPGAVLDFWQADAGGVYDNAGYTLRGRQLADAQGRYRLETVVPGEYPGRTPHIHVKVGSTGHPTLTTQVYFSGMPGNSADTIIDPTLITNLGDKPDGSVSAEFDFVFAP